MNLLSVGAAYGVLVAVFQYGWLDGFLGFESLGYINTMTPPFLLAIVFGLSMDYEVFLLTRIRERYEATGDTKIAVAQGLRASAATISSAALIMVAVFAVFAGTGVPSIKEIGLGPGGGDRPRRDARPAGARARHDGDHGQVELVAAARRWRGCCPRTDFEGSRRLTRPASGGRARRPCCAWPAARDPGVHRRAAGRRPAARFALGPPARDAASACASDPRVALCLLGDRAGLHRPRHVRPWSASRWRCAPVVGVELRGRVASRTTWPTGAPRCSTAPGWRWLDAQAAGAGPEDPWPSWRIASRPVRGYLLRLKRPRGPAPSGSSSHRVVGGQELVEVAPGGLRGRAAGEHAEVPAGGGLAGAPPRRSAAGRPRGGPRPGREHVGAAGHDEHRLAHLGEVDLVTRRRSSTLPAGQLVDPEEGVVELAEGAARVGEHVRHVVVDGLGVGERLAVVQVLGQEQRLGEVAVDRRELEAAARRAAPARRPGACRARRPARPPVSFDSRRIGANIRTCAKSNGLATIATDATGSLRSPATASRVMIPPRHQPTGWTGAPPASSDTASTAVGITSSTQCSRPSARSLKEIGAVVDQVGGVAERGEVLGQRCSPGAGRSRWRARPAAAPAARASGRRGPRAGRPVAVAPCAAAPRR